MVSEKIVFQALNYSIATLFFLLSVYLSVFGLINYFNHPDVTYEKECFDRYSRVIEGQVCSETSGDVLGNKLFLSVLSAFAGTVVLFIHRMMSYIDEVYFNEEAEK